MYAVGSVTYGLGHDRSTFIIAARLLSAVLGGLAVVLVFRLARRVGASTFAATLAALLVICSSVVPPTRRANDMYLQLFVVLAVYLLLTSN
jgi:dolichyl-phosphate-mannose--protein O-mannosyl transferase